MHIIVDAYNVLKAVSAEKMISNDCRKQFVRALSKYAQVKKHSLIVVFDGAEPWVAGAHYHDVEKHALVDVLYSGGGKSADECIKQLLAQARTKDALLVSSDRDLNMFAASLGIPSIGSVTFHGILENFFSHKNDVKKNGQSVIIKTSTDQDVLTDTLMQNASKQSNNDKEKIDFVELDNGFSVGGGKKQTDSRIEKKLLQKIKKL